MTYSVSLTFEADGKVQCGSFGITCYFYTVAVQREGVRRLVVVVRGTSTKLQLVEEGVYSGLKDYYVYPPLAARERWAKELSEESKKLRNEGRHLFHYLPNEPAEKKEAYGRGEQKILEEEEEAVDEDGHDTLLLGKLEQAQREREIFDSEYFKNNEGAVDGGLEIVEEVVQFREGHATYQVEKLVSGDKYIK
jgi:hypothetical protein